MLLVISGLLGLLAAVNGDVIVYTQETPHVIVDEFLGMPASFGPKLPLEGLRGFLVVGDPPDGCGNLTAPPRVINLTDKWVVLVGRYNCSFEEKVRNAMAAGYHCTIVHNVNSSELETMAAKNPEGIEIPSVFVSQIAGYKLAERYTYDEGYYVMVNDDDDDASAAALPGGGRPMPHRHTHIHGAYQPRAITNLKYIPTDTIMVKNDLPFNVNTHLLLPFTVVVGLCLIVILIFTVRISREAKPTLNISQQIMVKNDLPFNINTHLLLPFAVVVGLCLIVILIFTFTGLLESTPKMCRRHLWDKE